MAASTPKKPNARIFVVDDHPMVRDGLKQLISNQSDLVYCGEAGTAEEAQTAVAKLKPDLVILDLRLKGSDGLDLIKSLKAQLPALRILVLSQYESRLYVERALRAGALGYVVKEQAADQILQAIHAVLAGDVYLTRAMSALLLHKFVGAGDAAAPAGLEQLTDRELHVLQLLGAGLSTREIAVEIHLSFKTVETHRENIKHKLGLANAAELIHYANRWAQEQVALKPEGLPDSIKRLEM
jgi:DNA-binding NarL/FixJ family response regulator